MNLFSKVWANFIGQLLLQKVNFLGRIGFENLMINQAKALRLAQEDRRSKHLQDYEFKVFSQWGEDGILQHLVASVEIPNKTFIEFGVEDFFESNCRYLLMNDNWQGFVIDGSKSNINRLKKSYFYWRHELTAIDSFITQANINDVLAKSKFNSDLGILSIDLDGIDYFVLKQISQFRPRILICEYNANFGSERSISVPYRDDFQRTTAHQSNLFWGASLRALADLADQKGYALVGTNSAGNNAFFVRRELLNGRIAEISVDEAFAPAKYRESRDATGKLNYLNQLEREKLIQGLQVFNTKTGELEPF